MSKGIPGGYNGKILRVNLASKSITTEALDVRFCRQYIGGAGFIAYYLWKELKKGIDALSPDNKLIFALGPVTGLLLPGASRNCVGAKSPLTGGIAKSEVGGFWMAELKRAGYDVIIVEGKADKPVYLWIKDGEASIRDASHLWGSKTKETMAAIRTELGDDKIQVAMIGPAGENRVLYACIMNGLNDAAGRGGLGAVMGSKNLKAVAVRGNKLPEVANPERVKEIRQQLSGPHPVSEFGSGGPDMIHGEEGGNLPVRNFRDGIFPQVKDINGVAIKETIRIGMEGCFACPIRCKKIVQDEKPYHIDSAYGGPEYETLAGLGSDCGVGDVRAICKGNELCNSYSLDTISTGSTIAFAMECFERGLLTTKDTDGIEMKFGNADAMLKAIDLIAKRQGFGNLLAEGTVRMAKKIGKGSIDFAVQVKGLETGMHDARAKGMLGLTYMVSPQGGDHACGPIDDFFATEMKMDVLHMLGIQTPLPMIDINPTKVALFKLEHLLSIISDSMVMCIFPPIGHQLKADIMSAVTGWDMTLLELLKAAERILTVARLFNMREGLTSADDVLPKRFFQPKTDGYLADKPRDRAKEEEARNYYYTLMGWDEKGAPLADTVEALGIK